MRKVLLLLYISCQTTSMKYTNWVEHISTWYQSKAHRKPKVSPHVSTLLKLLPICVLMNSLLLSGHVSSSHIDLWHCLLCILLLLLSWVVCLHSLPLSAIDSGLLWCLALVFISNLCIKLNREWCFHNYSSIQILGVQLLFLYRACT